MSVKGIGMHSDWAASGYLGQSKKVAVTASAAVALIGDTSSQLGVVVRCISLDGSYVAIGSSAITLDSSTAPGAFVITNIQSGLTLNITGDLYAITDSGSASLSVTPILVYGFRGDLP